MNAIEAVVREFWQRHSLGECTVVVGYSGGHDSTALLHALCGLDGVKVIAAHLHHGMRGKAADEDVEHCRRESLRTGALFEVGYADVPGLCSEQKIGAEAAGRTARYEFFGRVCAEQDADLIATGHTLDDHVETVLMNVARGSGLQGLRGIPAVRGRIVRPILAVRRADTAVYCAEHGLPTILDATNVEADYRRNVLRRSLGDIYGETIYASVPRLAEIAAAEDELLTTLTTALIGRAARLQHPLWRLLGLPVAEYLLPVKWLSGRPLALRRRLVRGLADGAGFEMVEAALAGRGVTTEKGFRLWTEEDNLHIAVPAEPAESTNCRLQALVELPSLGSVLSYREGEPPPGPRSFTGTRAVFDRESIKGDLTVLQPPTGEYRPIGFGGTRSIRDLLSTAGLPGWLRDRVPAVCDDLGPIWVLGARIAERVKVTETTRQAAYLQVQSKQPAV